MPPNPIQLSDRQATPIQGPCQTREWLFGRLLYQLGGGPALVQWLLAVWGWKALTWTG